MDELEIRRRLLANPQESINDLSAKDRQLQTELIELDKELAKALQISVPTDLADRLMFNKTTPSLLAVRSCRIDYTSKPTQLSNCSAKSSS